MQNEDMYVIRPNARAQEIIARHEWDKSDITSKFKSGAESFHNRVPNPEHIELRKTAVKITFMLRTVYNIQAYFKPIPKDASYRNYAIEKRFRTLRMLIEFFGNPIVLSIENFDRWWTVERCNHVWDSGEIHLMNAPAAITQIYPIDDDERKRLEGWEFAVRHFKDIFDSNDPADIKSTKSLHKSWHNGIAQAYVFSLTPSLQQRIKLRNPDVKFKTWAVSDYAVMSTGVSVGSDEYKQGILNTGRVSILARLIARDPDFSPLVDHLDLIFGDPPQYSLENFDKSIRAEHVWCGLFPKTLGGWLYKLPQLNLLQFTGVPEIDNWIISGIRQKMRE